VDLNSPIGGGTTHSIDPITPTCGGITCNIGIALQRLGLPTGIVSYVGDDDWGSIVRGQLEREGVEHDLLQTHPTAPTTAVAVLVDERGERSFLAPGVRTATKSIDAAFVRANLEQIAGAEWFVLGYFGRMPGLEPDLPDVLQELRAAGIRTVMDTGGDGGDWEALAGALPFLDIFVPSLVEARGHTGLENPREILQQYRDAGAPGLIGVKLGTDGALLGDPAQPGWIQIPAIPPPGKIIDCTGAGDAFVAGLIAGLDRGLSVTDSGHLAAASGACATTAQGGYGGVLGWERVHQLSGVI